MSELSRWNETHRAKLERHDRDTFYYDEMSDEVIGHYLSEIEEVADLTKHPFRKIWDGRDGRDGRDKEAK